MIVGRPQHGSAIKNLTTGRVRVMDLELLEAGHLSHLACYLDGGGTGVGDALVRGVIFDGDDDLVASGDEVTVVDGQPASWVQLPFTAAAGLLLAPNDYSIGIHLGGVSLTARTFTHEPGAGGSRQASDVYADGTAPALPTATPLTADLPVVLSLFQPWSAPDVEDLELSRLPWDISQRVFAPSRGPRSPRVGATAGWHGTALDEEAGAVAIVRTDGPLADLVGERIRVTRRQGTLERSVALYVHDEQDFPDELADEDLSLSKTAFVRLAPWSTDALPVVVEVLS